MLDKKKSPAGGQTKQGKSQNFDDTNTVADFDGLVNPKAKSRYWLCVMYPENMIDDWQLKVGDLLQGLPYAYCLHHIDKDKKSEHRKDHIHFILAFSNTTTYNHAMEVYGALNAQGRKAFNTVQPAYNIRGSYDYLIHDTESCKKQGKELYPKEDRICGNNFDIGSFEQLSLAEKRQVCKELAQVIIDRRYINFADFYEYVVMEYEDANYFEVLVSYSGFFERLTKGCYQKWKLAQDLQGKT